MRIAVTGGIAEGKSTVLGYLSELGYSTSSSDAIARDVFRKSSVQNRLAGLLAQDAPVSASAVRGAIARSNEIRRAVNRLMHPEVAAIIAAGTETFVEVPLLMETCLQASFDAVWVVTCGPSEQLRRIRARYVDEAAANVLATQLSTSTKIPFADTIVRTNDLPHIVKCFVAKGAEATLSSWIARIQG